LVVGTLFCVFATSATAQGDYYNIIFHVVGPDGASKADFIETAHVTTNANDEIVIENTEIEARCPTT